MKSHTFRNLTLAVLMLGAVGTSMGQARDNYGRAYGRWNRYDMRIPAGTPINVRLDSEISTSHVQNGDTWMGTVSQSVIVDDEVAIPAGTEVQGVVAEANQGTRNSKPSLSLAVRSMNIRGRTRSVDAYTEPIIADSRRAKKIGAVALGAAAGALIGRGVAKDSHGTLIGGLLGGALGYGASRHALRTMVLKPGTELSFTTNEDVVARRW